MFNKERFSHEKYEFKLSPAAVDEVSDRTGEVLQQTKLSRKDIMRFRLSLEESMGFWLAEIGEGADCSFSVHRRLGRYQLQVTCVGPKVDPRGTDDPLFGMIQSSSFLQSIGLSIGFSYENGENRLSIMPASGEVMHLLPVLIALLSGLGMALGINHFLPDNAQMISEQIVSPIFGCLMDLLRTIAGPLIFLAVLSGIYGIGDISILGKIGKKLISRFIAMTFVTLVVAFAILLFFVPVQSGNYTAGGGTLNSLLTLVLQFIPTDIVSPFKDGNMLQIIFISISCGLGMLILGQKVSALCRICDQLYSVVQLLMEAIGKLIPLFVFVSILDFVLSGNAANIASVVTPILVIAGTLVAMMMIYAVRIRIKLKVKISALLKRLMPTFLVALTTASSAAAFCENVETCEKSLGISSRVTRFGIPLGQVVYMPIAAVEYLALSMILAHSFDVVITPMWVITAIIVCGILAIATPPIPGGALSIFTVLFIQLNIPSEALALAIGIDLLVDYLVTAGDISCLQSELLLSADKMDLLDRRILDRLK